MDFVPQNDLKKDRPTEGLTDRLTEDRSIDRTQKPFNHDFFTAVPHIEALSLSSPPQFLWGPKKDIIDKDRSTEGPTGRPTDRSTEDRPIDRSIKVHGNSMQMPKMDISSSRYDELQIACQTPSLAEAMSSEVGSPVFEAFLVANVRRIAEEKRLIRHVISFSPSGTIDYDVPLPAPIGMPIISKIYPSAADVNLLSFDPLALPSGPPTHSFDPNPSYPSTSLLSFPNHGGEEPVQFDAMWDTGCSHIMIEVAKATEYTRGWRKVTEEEKQSLSCEAVNATVYPVGIGMLDTWGFCLVMDASISLYGGPVMKAGLGLHGRLSCYTFDLFADPDLMLLLHRFRISAQNVFFTSNEQMRRIAHNLEAALLLMEAPTDGPPFLTKPASSILSLCPFRKRHDDPARLYSLVDSGHIEGAFSFAAPQLFYSRDELERAWRAQEFHYLRHESDRQTLDEIKKGHILHDLNAHDLHNRELIYGKCPHCEEANLKYPSFPPAQPSTVSKPGQVLWTDFGFYSVQQVGGYLLYLRFVCAFTNKVMHVKLKNKRRANVADAFRYMEKFIQKRFVDPSLTVTFAPDFESVLVCLDTYQEDLPIDLFLLHPTAPLVKNKLIENVTLRMKVIEEKVRHAAQYLLPGKLDDEFVRVAEDIYNNSSDSFGNPTPNYLSVGLKYDAGKDKSLPIGTSVVIFMGKGMREYGVALSKSDFHGMQRFLVLSSRKVVARSFAHRFVKQIDSLPTKLMRVNPSFVRLRPILTMKDMQRTSSFRDHQKQTEREQAYDEPVHGWFEEEEERQLSLQDPPIQGEPEQPLASDSDEDEGQGLEDFEQQLPFTPGELIEEEDTETETAGARRSPRLRLKLAAILKPSRSSLNIPSRLKRASSLPSVVRTEEGYALLHGGQITAAISKAQLQGVLICAPRYSWAVSHKIFTPEQIYLAQVKETQNILDYDTGEPVMPEMLRSQPGQVLHTVTVFESKNEGKGPEDCKCRCTINGSQQREFNPSQVSSPTVNAALSRAMLARCARAKGRITNALVDIPRAFLQTYCTADDPRYYIRIKKWMADILVELRPEYAPFLLPNGEMFLLMKKWWYGTKESGIKFNQQYSQDLLNLGYLSSDVAESFFRKNSVFITLHVDDNNTCFTRQEEFEELIAGITLLYGPPHISYWPTKYMGCDQTWDLEHGQMYIHCATRIERMLEEEDWHSAPLFDNPVHPSKIFHEDEESPPIDSKKFMQVVFLLLWMSLFAGRIDIALPVNELTQHASAPTADDWEKVMRIVGYLRANPSLGISLGEEDFQGSDDEMFLSVVSDASHGVYPEGHSHGGFILQVGTPGLANRCVVHWTSSKAKTLSRASMGSEVQYLLMAADKAEFLRQALLSVHLSVPIPMIFYTDSSSSIMTMRRTKLSSRMIHEIVRNNYLKQLVDKGIIILEHVRTDVCKADLLTKYLPTKRFRLLLEGMMTMVTL